jgi:predicted RNase H-like HicB family nuclease
MAQRRYWAIVEGSEKSGYSAFFPDLPGCVSAGDTIEQCIANAGDAAAFHLEGMVEDGDVIPAATPAHRLQIDPDIDEAARSLVIVPLPGKAVRVNVTLEEGLLQLIDQTAAALDSNRSAFLSEAARDKIRKHHRQESRSYATAPSRARGAGLRSDDAVAPAKRNTSGKRAKT